MGERGMADMGEMEMPLPDNTLPMMTGAGPFGAIEMGGMFTVVKVREGLARNDYKDPGWYRAPGRHGCLRVDGRAAAGQSARRAEAETRDHRDARAQARRKLARALTNARG